MKIGPTDMRTTVHIHEVEATPVAVKGPDGEWVEVGYVTALDYTVEQDEQTLWETPFRSKRRYGISMDLEANPAAGNILMDIVRKVRGRSAI